MTENNNRAVITGLGMICAIGNSVDEAWNNAINSVSGIHKTTTLDTTDCYADLAAEVKCDTLGDFEGSEDADRSAQLCIKAAGEAMKDAGLDDLQEILRLQLSSEAVSVVQSAYLIIMSMARKQVM